jgi:AcrR family transcriptional regulator
MSLREIKKERTREALVAAALRLFADKGYAGTTVAEIAEAAGMSTRTFFLHFPAKEDVLLAHGAPRVELGLAALAEATEGESVADTLARAVERMVADAEDKDLRTGLAATRARLMATEPALQARLLQRLLGAQTAFAEALQRAHPTELDAIAAAAAVGATLGAVHAAAEAALRRGDPPEAVRDAMLRAPRAAAAVLGGGATR